jgi:hypothetical protein
MEMAPASGPENQEADKATGGAARMEKANKSEADTSAAAKALLDKYIRRPRT